MREHSKLLPSALVLSCLAPKFIIYARTNRVSVSQGFGEKNVHLFLVHVKARLSRTTGVDHQNEFQRREERLVVGETEKDGAGYCRRCSPSTIIASCTRCPSLSYIRHRFSAVHL